MKTNIATRHPRHLIRLYHDVQLRWFAVIDFTTNFASGIPAPGTHRAWLFPWIMGLAISVAFLRGEIGLSAESHRVDAISDTGDQEVTAEILLFPDNPRIKASYLSNSADMAFAAADLDHDGISDSVESAFAGRYCPMFQFHMDEQFYFFNPMLEIQSTGAELNDIFTYGTGICPDDPFATTGVESRWKLKVHNTLWYTSNPDDFPYVLGRINAREVRASYPEIADAIDIYGWDDVVLIPPDNDFGYGDPDPCLRYFLDPNVPVFFMMEHNGEGNIELQYWQYSHYDRKGAVLNKGDHWGDWTRLVLVFENSMGTIVEPPLYVYYSAHKGYSSPDQDQIDCAFHPRYLFWADVSKWATHPIALVAKGSHELYFQTTALAWYSGVEYFKDGLPYGNCECKPFQIQEYWGNMYYDRVGIGLGYLPQMLVNMGNGDYPLVPWLTYGGHWGPGNSTQGPTGPLGISATSRMREHNIYRSTAFDDGSWVLNYRVLDVVGADVRGQFCSGSSTPFDLLHAIHKPLNFGYTAARIWNEVYVASGEGVLFGVGSFMFPRGSVYAANNYAPAGSVMNVYPGTYEEIVAPVVLNKRMTIRKWWGVPGLVVIKAK